MHTFEGSVIAMIELLISVLNSDRELGAGDAQYSNWICLLEILFA
jgi:hypothetical protein